MTPKSSFSPLEGKLLAALLWAATALFLGIMIVAWISSEMARPVFLDLETGKPAESRH